MENVYNAFKVGRLTVLQIVLSYLPTALLSILKEFVPAASLDIFWTKWETVNYYQKIVLQRTLQECVLNVKMALSLEMMFVINYQTDVRLLMEMEFVLHVFQVGILTVQTIVLE